MSPEILQLIIKAKDSASKNIGTVQKSLKKLSGGSKKVIGGMVAVGKKVAKFGAIAGTAAVAVGGFSVKMASDLQEVQNVVDVTFGESAEAINTWSKDAMASFGLTELQAKQFTGTMGATLKSMGLNSKQTLEMSTSLTGLSGDFASFYNLPHEEAFAKIKAGISGETEPLKDLGINMSVANMEAFALSEGINKSWNEMNQAEQSLLRYDYLMKKTQDAQGDFAETSGSFANQTRILKGQFIEIATTLGSTLIPLLTSGLGTIIQYFTDNKAAIESFIKNGIDWLIRTGTYLWQNVLVPLGQWLYTTGIQAWTLIKQAIDFLRPSIEEMIVAVKMLFGNMMEFWNANQNWIIPTLKFFGAILGGIVVGAIQLVIKAITVLANYLGTIIQYFTDNKAAIESFIKNGIDWLIRTGTYLWQNVLVPLGQWLYTTGIQAWILIKQAIDFLRPSIEEMIVSVKMLFDSMMEFWNANQSWIIPTLKIIGAIIGGVVIGTVWLLINGLKLLADVFTNILLPAIQWVIDLIRNQLIPIFMAVVDFFTTLFKPQLEILAGFWKIVWEGIKVTFMNVWDVLKTVVKVGWAFISMTIKNGVDMITGIFTAATQLLKGDWKGAWETISNTFSKVFERIKDTAKSIIDSIVKMFKGIGERIGDALSGMTEILKNAVKGAIKGIPVVGEQVADLLGFAQGGSFMVGGKPGTDSNMVAFKATKGEKVTVQTPEQQKGSDGNNVTFNNYFTSDIDTNTVANRFMFQLDSI